MRSRRSVLAAQIDRERCSAENRAIARVRYAGGAFMFAVVPRMGSILSIALSLLLSAFAFGDDKPAKRVFKAGAYAINVSPLKFPVIINGGMTERTADKITDPLHARCLVLDDGTTKAAIVIVDSCMMPRDLLDEAKQLASRATGIPTSHMLISATHTHSAPSVHGALGSDKDEDYARFLGPQIAKGIIEANNRLESARIGWAFGEDKK